MGDGRSVAGGPTGGVVHARPLSRLTQASGAAWGAVNSARRAHPGVASAGRRRGARPVERGRAGQAAAAVPAAVFAAWLTRPTAVRGAASRAAVISAEARREDTEGILAARFPRAAAGDASCAGRVRTLRPCLGAPGTKRAAIDRAAATVRPVHEAAGLTYTSAAAATPLGTRAETEPARRAVGVADGIHAAAAAVTRLPRAARGSRGPAIGCTQVDVGGDVGSGGVACAPVGFCSDFPARASGQRQRKETQRNAPCLAAREP